MNSKYVCGIILNDLIRRGWETRSSTILKPNNEVLEQVSNLKLMQFNQGYE